MLVIIIAFLTVSVVVNLVIKTVFEMKGIGRIKGRRVVSIERKTVKIISVT